MPRSPSSLLFLLVLGLSLALVVWWTIFQVQASGQLAAAGQALRAGDVDLAARALGARDAATLADVARGRRWMFASEGLFFGLTLLVAGWLYLASLRREATLRTAHDRFLAAATHELKTPLATIVLLLESLRAGRVPAAKLERHLESGLLEAERLERGLDNVLTAAGLRAAPRPSRPQPGDLVDDVRQALAAMQPRAAASGIAVAAELPASLPLRRDPVALQLALRNLLDNAIKYSAAGSTVHVGVERQRDAARIRVRDAGRGMDAEELRHAFTPFWRGSDQATGGSGLGLHLVRELVRAHGGTVAVHSEGRGRGTEVAVQLPLGEAP
ncbi:MAG: HAMP domain-containing histidine kinase [Planctomycetes bacterium]|nr:HAMP domain-containing histidine kinase [Planctomycetota bacterium]